MFHTFPKGDHHMKTLLRFLQNGKTQFHVAALAKEYLDAHNFTQISDRENLTELAAGRYYLAPFSSIVIPFVKGAQSTQVRIACAHTDFPMLKVKPNPELKKLGYLQINVEPYGDSQEKLSSRATQASTRKSVYSIPKNRLLSSRTLLRI